MTNRNVLLGRSKPSEKLTGEEIAALDKATTPPAPTTPPAKPPGKKGGGQQRTVRRDLLKFRWSLELPRLRFQGQRRRPAPARATAGEVRPLQSGPRPGRRVTLRTTTILIPDMWATAPRRRTIRKMNTRR